MIRITKEDFEERLIAKYNINKENFIILNYDSIESPCSIKCLQCNNIMELKSARSFLRPERVYFCKHKKSKEEIKAEKEKEFQEKRLNNFKNRLKEKYPEEDLTVLKYTKMDELASIQCNNCKTIYSFDGAHFFHNSKKRVCTKCRPLRQDTVEVGHKVEYILKNNNNLIVITPYNKITDNLELQCKKCNGIFKRMPRVFLKSQKCPYCETHSIKRTKEIFQNELNNKYQNEYTLLGDYIDTNTPTLFQHNDCGFIFKSTPHNILQSAPCPKCKRFNSKGEIKIKKILEEHDIIFETQKRYDKLPLLSFDFYIPSQNLLIEFQGEQHFHSIKHFGGETKFKKQVENDNKKRQFCKNNNIKLFEIKYDEINNIEQILDFLWFND